jgi:PhzF family phenazine biosynthesis protein
MTRKVQVHQVDAFTRAPFTGNPAGVVLNADGLADTAMLSIARELNNADTAFVMSRDGDDHDVRLRFFTPRMEAGFVGHATVAAHYVLSRRHDAPRHVRQKSKAGIVNIEVRGADEARRIAVRQSRPPLASDDLDVRCPIQIVGGSSTRLMVGVRGQEQLKQLKPDPNRLTTLSAQLGAAGYFVFMLQPGASDHLTESRMFCPALGIPEDPVSGNAHGLLGVYLADHKLLTAPTEGRVKFAGAQGHFVHRAGRVDVELEMKDGAVDGVWIVGQAVSIFETEIVLS